MPVDSKDFLQHIFLQELIKRGSSVGYQLGNAFNLPLRKYLKSLFPKPLIDSPNQYHLLVVKAFEQELVNRGESDIETICENLLHMPVIEEADHSNLLLDKETFLNNYLFHVACRENGVNVMVIWQCSTVSCITRRSPIAGPVFLRTRGDLYKVFPISNYQLTKTTFCCLTDPLDMTFELVQGSGAGREDPFLQQFIGRRIPNAPDGYRLCNDEIWNSFQIDSKTRRVAVDESLSSRIVARHLLDNNSPITRLLFDEKVRDAFLKRKREMVATHEFFCVNRAVPDFFWYRSGSVLVPVVLVGTGCDARLNIESKDKEFPISYDRQSIMDALNAGILYPDKLLIYLVRCILPRIVAVGGTAQQDYVAMYIELLRRTQHDTDFMDEIEMRGISEFDVTRLGGAPLLELSDAEQQFVEELGPLTDFDAFEHSFIDRTVGETIGKLECANFYYKEFEKKSALSGLKI